MDRVTGIQKIGRSCTESKFQNPTWNHRAYVIVNKGFDVIRKFYLGSRLVSALDSMRKVFETLRFPPRLIFITVSWILGGGELQPRDK